MFFYKVVMDCGVYRKEYYVVADSMDAAASLAISRETRHGLTPGGIDSVHFISNMTDTGALILPEDRS